MNGRWSPRILAIAAVGVVALATGVAVAPGLYQRAKELRARHLVSDIGKFYESGNWHGYELRLLAASRLAPDHPSVMLAQARYLTVRRHPLALEYWLRAVERHASHTEVWEPFFLACVELGNLRMASMALEGFRRAHPAATDRRLEHEVLLLSNAGKIEEAIEKTRRLLERKDPAVPLQLAACRILLRGNPEDRDQALARLWNLAKGTDTGALAVLSSLAKATEVVDSRRDEIAARLRVHPEASLQHGYLATALEAQGMNGREDRLNCWKNFIEDKPLAARIRIGEWLVDAGLPRIAATALEDDEWTLRRDGALLRVEILGMSGDWSAIGELLDQPGLPLPEALIELFKARVAVERERPFEFEFAWKRALQAAGSDRWALGYLANYAEANRWLDEAEAACRQLVRTPRGSMRGWMGLYNLAIKHASPELKEEAGEALNRLLASSQ